MRQHIRHTRILSNLDAKEITRMAGTIARFSKEYPEFPIVEFLDHSAFDELISIDLEQDTYRFIFNVEQKYWSPSMEGVYSAFINYVGTRMVHPEDQQLYLDMMDPQRLPIHLEAADDGYSSESPLNQMQKSTKTAQAKRAPPERMVLKALIKSFPCRLHVSVMVSKEQ